MVVTPTVPTLSAVGFSKEEMFPQLLKSRLSGMGAGTPQDKEKYKQLHRMLGGGLQSEISCLLGNLGVKTPCMFFFGGAGGGGTE